MRHLLWYSSRPFSLMAEDAAKPRTGHRLIPTGTTSREHLARTYLTVDSLRELPPKTFK
jgi:hypothetical protein